MANQLLEGNIVPEDELQQMFKSEAGSWRPERAGIPSMDISITAPGPTRPKPPALGGDIAEVMQAQKELSPMDTTPQVGAFVRTAKNIYNGVRLGVMSEAEAFDNLARVVSNFTGVSKPEVFQKFAEWVKPSEVEIAAGGTALLDKVARSIGMAIPMIAEFAVATPVVGAGLKALKAPQAIKLGSTAFTQGKRLLGAEEIGAAMAGAKAAKEAKQIGKFASKLPGMVPLAEPITFGAIEAGHEAVRPESSLLSTLEAGAKGATMGTALPLTRGLPIGARQVAGGGVFGGMAAIEPEATSEDALASFFTGAVLTSMGDAKTLAEKALGKKTPPTAAKIPEPTEQVKTAATPLLKSAVDKFGYANTEGWSPSQIEQVIKLTPKDKRTGEAKSLLNVEFNPETKDMFIKYGKYRVPVPPKTGTTAGIPEPQKSATELKATAKEEEGTYNPVDKTDVGGGAGKDWLAELHGKSILKPFDQMSPSELSEAIRLATNKAFITKLEGQQIKNAAREDKIIENSPGVINEKETPFETLYKITAEITQKQKGDKEISETTLAKLIQIGLKAEDVPAFEAYLSSPERKYPIKIIKEAKGESLPPVEELEAEYRRLQERITIDRAEPETKTESAIAWGKRMKGAGDAGLAEARALFDPSSELNYYKAKAAKDTIGVQRIKDAIESFLGYEGKKGLTTSTIKKKLAALKTEAEIATDKKRVAKFEQKMRRSKLGMQGKGPEGRKSRAKELREEMEARKKEAAKTGIVVEEAGTGVTKPGGPQEMVGQAKGVERIKELMPGEESAADRAVEMEMVLNEFKQSVGKPGEERQQLFKQLQDYTGKSNLKDIEKFINREIAQAFPKEKEVIGPSPFGVKKKVQTEVQKAALKEEFPEYELREAVEIPDRDTIGVPKELKAQHRPGTPFTLYAKDSLGAKNDGKNNFLEASVRAKLVTSLKLGRQFNEEMLKRLDDTSLAELFLTKSTADNMEPTPARGKLALNAEKGQLFRMKAPAGDVLELKTSLGRALRDRAAKTHLKEDLDRIDWDKLAELKQSRTYDQNLTEPESKRAPMFETEKEGESAKIAEGGLEEVGIGIASNIENAIVGFMAEGIPRNRALEAIERGQTRPYNPEILNPDWVPKGPSKRAVWDIENSVAQFIGRLEREFSSEIKSEFQETLPADLGKDLEIKLLNRALQGLELPGERIGNYRKSFYRRFNDARTRGDFEWAAGDALKGTLKAINYDKEKPILFKEYDIKEGIETGKTKEASILEKEAGTEIATPGGAQERLGQAKGIEKIKELMGQAEDKKTKEDFEKEGVDQAILSDADKLIRRAYDRKTPDSTYLELMALRAEKRAERERVIKEAWVKLEVDKDTSAWQALKDREEQLTTDIAYLDSVKGLATRIGDPYTMGKTYLEGELAANEHGIDGLMVSEGSAQGSKFYILQNAEGTRPTVDTLGTKVIAEAALSKKGKKATIDKWEMPKDITPEAEDALYNAVLDRYIWSDKPISVVTPEGIAEGPRERKVDQRYAAYIHDNPTVGIAYMAPEEKQVALAIRARKAEERRRLIEQRKLMGGKEITAQDKVDYLNRATSLEDSKIDMDIMSLQENPAEIGFSDPRLNAMNLRLMPFSDIIGDPTQSRILPVARVGQYAKEAKWQIKYYIENYMNVADERFGWIKNDPNASRELMTHLHYDEIMKDRSATVKADLESQGFKKSTDPKILQAADDYRALMEDMAKFFKLEEKGLYRPGYATISYDLDKVWDKMGGKLAAANTALDLPDSILGMLPKGEYFGKLKEIYETGKKYSLLSPQDKSFIMKNFLQWNMAYDTWEKMPAATRAMIPKGKFNSHFQHRNAESIMEFALKEDFWDVLSRYVRTTVHDGILNDFFLPKARGIANTIPSMDVGNSKITVRGYLDSYIRQVAGFKDAGPIERVINDWGQQLNSLMGKEIFNPGGTVNTILDSYTQMLYRGALGVDTAVRNLTQSLYTVAEVGPENFLKGLKDYVTGYVSKSPEYQKFAKNMDMMTEFYGDEMLKFKEQNPSMARRIDQINRRITDLALYPLRITERINKGIAYFAGLAEAAKLGLDFHTAHIIGLQRTTDMFSPLEMTDAEWRAMRVMGSTQFQYGPTFTSPLMSGNISKFFTPFWSFPAKTIQFATKGFKDAFGAARVGDIAKGGMAALKGEATEPFLHTDKAALVRFLALTGFMATAPQILAGVAGIDVGNLWGKGLIPNTIYPIWLQGAQNLYTSVLGGTTLLTQQPASQAERDKAWRDFSNSLLILLVPQYRFGKKAGNIYENIEKGYYGMGNKNLPVGDTNTVRELFNLFGFPPYMKEAKEAVWDVYGASADYGYKKQKALREASDAMLAGDSQKAARIVNDYYKDTKRRLENYEIQDYIMYRNTEDAYSQALKSVPTDLRSQYAQKLREVKGRYLGTRKGTRGMYQNANREDLTEEDEE